MPRSDYHPHPHLRFFLAVGGIGLLVVAVLAGVTVARYPAPAAISPALPVEIRAYDTYSETIAGEPRTVFDVLDDLEAFEIPAAVVSGSSVDFEPPPGAVFRASWFGFRGSEELNAVVRESLAGFTEPIPLLPEGFFVLPGRYEFVLGMEADGRMSQVFAHLWVEVRFEDE